MASRRSAENALILRGLIASALVAAVAGVPDDASWADTPGVSPGDAQALEALGYVDYGPRVDNPRSSGVVRWDRERAQDGINLVTLARPCRAQLVTLAGDVVHAWNYPDCHSLFSAVLLTGGDLVIGGSRRRGELVSDPVDRFVVRLGRSGEMQWKTLLAAHHHIHARPSGEVRVLDEHELKLSERAAARVGLGREMAEARDSGIRVRDDRIVTLSPGGEISAVLSLYEAATAPRSTFEFLSASHTREAERDFVLFHANAVQPMPHPELAEKHWLYAPEHDLVTSRNQNRVLVVNRVSRLLAWSWGVGELEGPHDGSWLPNGNLLIFDNGRKRKRSRVIELDPVAEKIVWQYPDERKHKFYTAARGAAERLPNGNTLITASQLGQVFEVTPSGEVVWDYRTPVLDANQRRSVIVRTHRIRSESVADWLSVGTTTE